MNTIFCRQGSNVGEINAGANNPCYLAMTNQLGLTFNRFSAICTDPISNRENMNVDLDAFTQQLRKFVGEAA